MSFFSIIQGSIYVSTVSLNHCDVVEGFQVIRSVLESIFVALEGKVNLTQHGINIPNVVPQIRIGERIVLTFKQSSLKARVEKMVLMIGKTTQSHVVPQFQRLIPQLDESLV